METVMARSSSVEIQEAFPAYKQVKNPKKIYRSFVSKSSQNMHIQRGLLLAPPPPPSPPPSRSLSYSYPPSLALHNYNNIQHQQTSPPLLPLPVTKPRHNSLPSPSRKATRARDQSLTPKKSKQPTRREEPVSTTTTKQDFTRPAEKKIAKPQQTVLSESLMVAPTSNRLGPDPNDLPKDVSKVFCAGIIAVNNNQDFEKFSGSLFTISPPPSSLPLPKFSMRPKQLISCNAEAASGIDAGATDDLRRLLRLR